MLFGVNTMRLPLELSCLVHGYTWVELVFECDYWAENDVIEKTDRRIGASVVIFSYSVLVLIGMGM